MKKLLYTFLGIVLFWMIGVFWSLSWIDKRTLDDSPGVYQLAAARLLWSSMPAIDKEADADRMLKLSWLKVTTRIYRKGEKEIAEIVQVLAEELRFVGAYLTPRVHSLSPDTQANAAVQLLTYLNRIELYQPYANPALELKLQEFGSSMSIAPPATQENWYRETMIRAHMKRDKETARIARERLVNILNEHAQDAPADFREGALLYYDGVLACIDKDFDRARQPLSKAARLMKAHPALATNFFYGDLNALLIGKGMEEKGNCRNWLSDLLKS